MQPVFPFLIKKFSFRSGEGVPLSLQNLYKTISEEQTFFTSFIYFGLNRRFLNCLECICPKKKEGMEANVKGWVGGRRPPGKYDTIIQGDSHDKQR
jgi:hypothetical protein